VDFDDRYYTMAGYEPQEFQGCFEEWKRRVHPDDRAHCQKAIEQYLGEEIPLYDVEFRFKRKDDTWMWIRAIGKVVEWDDERKPARFLGIHSDITERKQAEDELLKHREHLEELVEKRTIDLRQEITERKQAEEKSRQQKEFLNNIIESLTHPFYVIDAYNYNIILANSHARALGSADAKTCYALTYELGFHCQGVDHPCPLQELKRTKKPVIVEHIHSDQDGNPRYIEIHGFPILNETGDLVRMIEYMLDITDRKRAEAVLQQRTYELAERVKELNCLYGIARLVEEHDISFDDIMQGTVELIPPSWQYSEITCAKITINDREFQTINFAESEWMQHSDIIVNGEPIGSVTVCYLAEKPISDEGPFVKEERLLINAISKRLGRIIEYRRE